MDSGFITINRKILEWEWYNDIPTKTLFIHLLLTANHADKKWRGIMIERGSLITSLEKLSVSTGLSVKQIRTSILKLKKTGEVASQSTNNYSLISITNYDLYQSKGKPDGKQKTNGGQTEGNQRATTKELNNYNNENNTYVGFDFFWQNYPKQRAGSKDKALQAYIKALDRDEEQNIHNGVLLYAQSDEVKRGYAKGAQAWLNDDRWKNDYRKVERNGKESDSDRIKRQTAELMEQFGN